MMKWKKVRLTDISKLKQWKNLPISELSTEGFPVYGANGIIGRYKEYNHQFPTLAITCRGATCGTINSTEPKSYITSNAMALDNISEDVDQKFLYYALNRRGFKDVITGAAQPQITREGLSKIVLDIPESKEYQLHIANLLSKAENLIAQRKESIRLLDEFLKSTFLEMFGEVSCNKKKFDKVELKYFGEIITGNTPSRKNPDNYSSNFIEWIKTDNITSDNTYVIKAVECLSERGLKNARTASSGSLLVACIAGSIESVGRAALTDRTVSFNQQINAIQPNKDVEPLYLYWLFKISKKYIQNHASKGMKKILTKGEFEKIKMIKPPLELQTKFARIVEKTEALKEQYKQSLQELENLYGCPSQKAFHGEMCINKKVRRKF